MPSIESMIIECVSEYADDDSEYFKGKKQILNQQIQLQKNKMESLKKEKKEKNKNLIFLDIITFGVFRYFRNKKFNDKKKKIKNKIKHLKKEIINLISTEEHYKKVTLLNAMQLFVCYKQQQKEKTKNLKQQKAKKKKITFLDIITFGVFRYFTKNKTEEITVSKDNKLFYNPKTKTFYLNSNSNQDEDFEVLQKIDSNSVSSNENSFLNDTNLINNLENGFLENSINLGKISLQG